jgi:hypothetical protein
MVDHTGITDTLWKNIQREYDPAKDALIRKIARTQGAPPSGSTSPGPKPPDDGVRSAVDASGDASMARPERGAGVGGRDAIGTHGGGPPRVPDRWQRVLDAGAAGQEAAERLGQDAAIGAGASAELYREQAERLGALEDARLKREGERAAMAERAGLEVDRAAADARDTRIDPNRAWAGADAGTKIAVVLGGILGGIMQARMGGGPNQFLTEVNRIRDEDIATQKAAVDQKWKGVEAKRGVYRDMLARFGDERAAELAAKVALNENIAARAQQRAAENDSITQRDRAQMLSSELAKQNESLRASIIDRMMAVGARASGAAVPGSVAGADAKNLIKLPDGSYVISSSEEGAKKTNARIAFENEIGALQNQAEAVFRKHGRAALVPGTAGYMALEQIREKALPAQSLATEQGVLREHERGPTLAALGLAPSMLREPLEQIANARTNLHTGSRELIRQHGGQQVRAVDVQLPSGQVQRQYIYVAPEAPAGRQVIPREKE